MHTQLITSLKQTNKIEVNYFAQDEKLNHKRVKIDQVSTGSCKGYYFLKSFNRCFKINHILTLLPVTSNEQVVG